MTAWFRRHRWALLALPVVLALTAVLASGRLFQFWLPEQQYDAVRGTGEVHYTETYEDVGGSHQRAVDVRLLDVTPVTKVRDELGEVALELPVDTVLWGVDLHITADPDQVLLDCTVALVDDDGRLHTSEASRGLMRWNGYAPLSTAGWCVPADAPGPSYTLGIASLDTYDGAPRPESYEVRSYVLTPADASPEAVRLWWGRGVPRYAEITWD